MKKSKQYKRQSILQLLIVIVAVILVNLLLSNFVWRIDLTKEKRFTVSTATKNLLNDLNDVAYVEIFLEGELPADYRRFQVALVDLLNEYRAYSDRQIEYDFTDPFAQGETQEANEYVKSLMEKGLEVRQVAQQSLKETTRKFLIPGAIIRYQGREIPVNFLQEQSMNEATDEVVTKGISTLEYNLSNALQKLFQGRKEKIAFIQGHGELDPIFMADFAGNLQAQQYDIELFDLPNRISLPVTYDVAIIAKPTQPFSEKDKFKIDQYIMGGGKVLWLIDGLQASLDSLMRSSGDALPTFLTEEYQLNLEDMLFQYGARVNDDLVQDLINAQIPLFAANAQQPTLYNWPYYPIVYPAGDHPITKHLDPVLFQFASSVDTIQVPDVQKTVLLSSSAQSRVVLNPVRVSLAQATAQPMPEQYTKSNIPLGVLLEGEFKSIFRNRLTDEFMTVYQDSLGGSFKDKSVPTKMIVIGDGDFIKNDITRTGAPAKLGFYRFNPNFIFANKNFLFNSIDYLTDNYGLIATRTKEFKTRPLDRDALSENVFKWQLINLVLPIILIAIFAFTYNIIRRRKYTH